MFEKKLNNVDYLRRFLETSLAHQFGLPLNELGFEFGIRLHEVAGRDLELLQLNAVLQENPVRHFSLRDESVSQNFALVSNFHLFLSQLLFNAVFSHDLKYFEDNVLGE